MKKTKGFTLIELMVVIAIIGLLSSVVLASLKGAREKAQITKTVGEIKSLQTALELYRNKFGIYPQVVHSYSEVDVNPVNQFQTFVNLLINNKFLTGNIKSNQASCYQEEAFYCSGFVYIPTNNTSNYYTCGGERARNYILVYSTKQKINFPQAKWVATEDDPSGFYSAGEYQFYDAIPYDSYDYCISN